jgi:hypothetical protein
MEKSQAMIRQLDADYQSNVSKYRDIHYQWEAAFRKCCVVTLGFLMAGL